MEQRHSIVAAVILGLASVTGLTLLGYFVGDGLYAARAGERYVTVRGLVERPAKADIAVWSISYTATGDDVSRANEAIERDKKLVVAFAHSHGFSDREIEPVPSHVTDTSAYRPNGSGGRYLVQGGIRIRSANVERVQQAGQMTGDLIGQGVVLSLEGEGAFANPAYYFTGLDAIRPAMLAEATKSARRVAEQFANDSGSRLGPIRRANQGVFEIDARDESGPENLTEELRSIDKKVRLVSTIDYYLER